MRTRWPISGYLTYAGLVLGVVFVATPAKFLAPHLSLPVALEVGRHTFQVFNRLEWLILAALLACGIIRRPAALWWLILAGVAALVAMETVWLLPTLDARVQILLQGGAPPPSSLHRLYIAVEGLKVVILLTSLVRPMGLLSPAHE
jgi:hypothetical protein